ncbi:MAG: 50S ribosomal protein L11 methyltransferase [Synergistaceae bacterium]|nr:50S ribosomal protein L11 methyltransferase [Synergistaceae bacterium]
MDGVTDGDFWWSIELETDAGVDVAVAEETLMSVADLSGCIGSELFIEENYENAEKIIEGEIPVLRAAYRSSEPIEHWLSILEDMKRGFPGLRVRSYTKVENRPWHTLHLDAFPPLPVGAELIVMAPWHRDRAPAGRIPLYICPGSAFGTGYHESTQIALSFVERFVSLGDTFVDVGAGSGILFIAALKLGALHAVARDLDPTTVAEALRNMELNDLPPGACNLAVSDLLKGVDVQANVLTANMVLEPNLKLLPDVGRVLDPKGVAVFSGMTVRERATFLSAVSEAGLSLVAELTKSDWWGCAVRFGC